MFTVVPRPEIIDHRDRRPVSGEPIPTILDHRHDKKPGHKWQDGNKKDNQSYERIKQQRDSLALHEIKYKRRIKELEKENEGLANVFETISQENKNLTSQILHGPNAQKIKKLKDDKKELLSELETVKEENVKLSNSNQELKKTLMLERDYYVEKKWQEALERGRKRRKENEGTASVQGPFLNARKPNKRDITSVKDEDFENQDEYDLHIDTLENETQILLNDIKKIKENKDKISYAHFIGKGAITRNSAVANAVNEKLERDLVKFEERLEMLSKKARTLNIETNVNQLKPNCSDAVHDKTDNKIKPKQKFPGNKYFRSKKIQTEIFEKENPNEQFKSATNESKVKIATVVKVETSSTKSGERKLSSTTRSNNVSGSPNDNGINQNESITTLNIKVTEESNSTDQRAKTTPKRASQTQSKSPNSSAPMEERWDQMAFKLTETEKYKQSKEIKKGFTHRDMKIKTPVNGNGRQPNNSGVSRLKGDSNTSVTSNSPKRPINFHQNFTPVSATPEISKRSVQTSATNSVKSQRGNLSEKTTSPTKNGVDPKFELSKYVVDKCQTNVKQDADYSLARYKQVENTTVKLPRKTTNPGEIIHYIPKQHNWDINGNVRTNDQAGRYSNGPEPIGRKNITKRNVKNAPNFRPGSKDVVIAAGQNPELGGLKTRKQSLKSKNITLTRQASENEVLNTRDVSAYDEVLAELSRQYNEHSLNNTSGPEPKREDREEHVTARQGAFSYARESLF